MQNKYYLFIVITIFALPLKAQVFEGGFKAGITTSQIHGDRVSGYHHIGLMGGAYAKTNIDRFMSIQFEIGYFAKGAGKKITVENPGFFKINLHYIELPVLFQYEVYDKVTLEIGPSIGYLMYAEEDLDGNGFLEPDPPYRNLEFAGKAGAMYQISDRLFVNARFTHSILPVRNHPGGQTYFLNMGQYNNSLSFGLLIKVGR